MSSLPETPIPPDLIANLLSQPAVESQTHLLQQTGLWHEEGLAHLLNAGSQLINADLIQARQLLDLCVAIAPLLAPDLLPQALYLRAQTFALDGEFEQALLEIAAAQTGYEQTGQQAAALRTNAGLLNVLIHLGRYQEALAISVIALERIAQAADAMPLAANALLTALILNSQGNCYKFMGRYNEAFAAFRAAESHFDSLPDQQENVASIHMNLGVILAELGRGSEALTIYETAAATFAQAGNLMRQAQILENMGELHLWLGNYNQSLAAFAEARQLFERLDAPIERHILERLTADAYLTLNLLPEAAAAYRQAIAGLESGNITYHLGWALWGLGATLLRQQRLAEAKETLQRAAELFAEAENHHLLSAVLLEQAALVEAEGDRAAALQQTRRALSLIAGQDWPVQRIYAHLRLADLLLPDTTAAEPFLQEARELAETLPLPNLRFRVHQRLGRLYLLQGREAEAETMMTTAIAEIERLRGALARQTLRASFLQDKTAVYEDLATLYLSRGDQNSLQKAFNVAEQAKSRSLVDLLTGVIKTQLHSSADPDLMQRLQTLQADLHAIYNEALRDNSEGDRAVRLTELNEQAAALEQQISRLRLQLDDSLTNEAITQTIPFAALQQTLLPNQTLLAYYVLGEELLAFVYRDNQLHVIRHLSRAPVITQHLTALAIEWQRFQADPAFIQRHLPQLTRSVQRILYALYQELIAPVITLLADAAWLTIIPHGLLHQLPFAALFDGHSYLVDQFQVTVAPSATVLSLCAQRQPLPSGQAIVLGMDDPHIPYALHEAKAVSRSLPQARLHLGEQATLTTLQTETAGCSLLHLACHGLFRHDNPLFSALKLDDGWLTAADVMQFELPGAFVTLSACESGRSEVIGGDELLGLTYAFLSVGAIGLLVSLWLVEDETTAALMTRFYGQLAQGDSYAAALRQAQLMLKASHPHPYYWAPFILVGQN